MSKKVILVFLFAFFLFSLKSLTGSVFAISNAQDIISTSRPSSYTTLGVGVSLNATLAVVVDNGSRWIASDSATIIGATTFSTTVASMSAASIPAANQRTVYFATKATGTGSPGAVIYTPIVAKHTISFRNSVPVPSNGKIQLVFPVGVGNTGYLPSANAFSFNNLNSNNISISGGGVTCSSWTIAEASGIVQCNLGTGLTGSATVSITIGSSYPALINPSKTATAGTADTWTIKIKTLDSSSVGIDRTP